jgi:RimJ/RimL family protein N-acetyltransferase
MFDGLAAELSGPAAAGLTACELEELLDERGREVVRQLLQDHIPAMPFPYSQSDARTFIEDSGRGWAEGNRAGFVIAHAADGDGLGTIGLHLFAGDAELAAVGYWLRREARGHGAATIAVRLVSAWAFDELGIKRLNLFTLPGNVASQRVAERAGFTREGILRAWLPTRDGRRDSVMFSLLPDDQNRKPSDASMFVKQLREDSTSEGAGGRARGRRSA